MERSFIPPGASPKFVAEAPYSDDPCIQHYRLAAIDFAHRQSRQLVLIRRANRRDDPAHPMPERHRKVTTDKTFADLGVRAPLVNVLAAAGITLPFPIQVQTLPDTLAGRDVLGRGKTGSGKTLAFSIPLVSRLSAGNRRPSRPSGLVLAPTRELATQITATLEPLAAAYNLRVSTIFGGVPQNRQVAALKSGIDIVVACPGRLEDLMKQRLISLDAVEITVIDEADHMADLGFLPSVTRILAAHTERRPASAVLRNPRQRRRQARQSIPAQRGAALCRRPQLAGARDDPPRVPRLRGTSQEGAGAPARLRYRPPNPVHAHQTSSAQARQAAHRIRYPRS